LGNNLHKIEYHMPTFYGFGSSVVVQQMAFVFRNASGSIVGRDPNGNDIYYDVYPPNAGLIAKFLAPSTTLLINPGDSIEFIVASNQKADMKVYDNGTLVFQDSTKQDNFYLGSTVAGVHTGIEEAADEFRARVLGDTGDQQALLESVIRHTSGDQGLRVRILPVSVMGSQLRRYDYHRREILLSEALLRPQRTFHLLVQLALTSPSSVINKVADAHGLEDGAARSLFRSTLAGYFAGAVMMPYDAFLGAARDLRYDLDLLGRRFGASFEQVCHRLTSLNAPNARGIPFFFIRIDDAGNISKRLAAGGMQFAKNGGTCPRWDIHKAFRTPDRMLYQAAELPNGQKFFTIVRTVPRPWAPAGEAAPEFAVALGCELHHARDIVYADAFDLSKRRQLDPIGIGCAVCERMDCAQRAHPPVGHEVRFDGHSRRIGLYDLEG